jgi:type 1 glutamine amidotransferase
MKILVTTFICGAIVLRAQNSAQIPVLIIDGQNNHDWQHTTPLLRKILEDTGLFRVEVLTTAPKGADFGRFRPEFEKYRAVISNYNDFGGGAVWPPEAQAAFEQYVRGGGGFVSYHAADNAFPNWPVYNVIIGMGGWEGRDEKSGPFWYFREGKLVSDTTPGQAGNHGARKPFQVMMRDRTHPIAKGLPEVWMHASDELYSRMRGPGENMTVLGTAFSDPHNRGTGHDEPMLMALSYGIGRVFHTTLGHDPEAIRCVGFITTFLRGVEWAATGKVTQKVPDDFPTAAKVSTREIVP